MKIPAFTLGFLGGSTIITTGRLALLLIMVFVLGACASQTRKPDDPLALKAYQQRFDYLESLSDWKLEGRLAASNGKDGGSGSFTWYQDHDITRMTFRGAMGKGSWELEARQGYAHLQLADGREFFADTIAELVTAHMQAKVPVDALSWWVLGLARPNGWQERDLDEDGRIERLRQFGWDVDFSAYKQTDSVWLPGKLVARNKDHSVKLAVRHWTLNQGAALE